MRLRSGSGLAVLFVLAVAGPGFAQAQSPQTGGNTRYEQHNLGPTGCDILLQT